MTRLWTATDLSEWAQISVVRIPELVNANRLPQPIRLSRKVDDWR